MVQVPGVGVGGTGQQTGTPAAVTAQVQATLAQIEANKAAAAAAAAERAATPGVNGYGNGPGPISSVLPNNFFGFLMIALWMR